MPGHNGKMTRLSTRIARKQQSITLLVAAEIMVMTLWFSSAAVLPDMVAENPVSGLRQAMLSSAVQAGFAIGAVVFALLGLADRFDPRRVFMLSALGAALLNAGLLALPIGSSAAICVRFLTGALLAGVYPVGMKIAVGWGEKDRGLLVGLLVGALTLGSAAPHLLSLAGGADWRSVVAAASVLSALGGGLVLFAGLGPHHAQAIRFRFANLKRAWTDKRIRAAFAGYLGHMWELYAMWAWIGIALTASFALRTDAVAAANAAKLTAFSAIGIGAIACVAAGLIADRIGKAEVTILAMAGSGSAALAAAFSFGGPIWIVALVFLLWGAFIVADSAQFSALVADYAPPAEAGALMTLQTALGFALTVMTVQATPWLAEWIGWRGVFAVLAAGPALGIAAMWQLRQRPDMDKS